MSPARTSAVGDRGFAATWLDLPGIEDYEMEACFYDPDARVCRRSRRPT